MKYKFKKFTLWEELRAAVGDKPLTVIDSGDEIVFDFEDTLSDTQEQALVSLMESKPLLRGMPAKLIEKGEEVHLTTIDAVFSKKEESGPV